MGRLWKYLADGLAALGIPTMSEPTEGWASIAATPSGSWQPFTAGIWRRLSSLSSHSWQAGSRNASDGTEGSIWRTVMLWWGVALYLLAVVTISVAAAIGTWHLLTPEQRQQYRARMETIRKVRITRR
jgi:hypothetical protein